jgi:transposase
MRRGVEVTRRDLSVDELRLRAARCRDGRVACRVLAIAHVLEGTSRTKSAEQCGFDRQTLRDLGHRYNAHGIAGLSDVHRSGRPAAISCEQMQELKDLVLAGPDLAKDGVGQWRCVDLQSVIKDRWHVEMHERTVGKVLRRLGLTRLQARPYHLRKDADAQAAFKKNFAACVAEVLPPTATRKTIEIWFQML